MAGEVYQNKFVEGIDKDSDPKIRKNTTYFEGHHVQLTGDGKYGGVQNLKGTTFVATVLSGVTYPDINVLGAYTVNTYVSFSSTVEECVYIFYVKKVAEVYTFVIDVYRKANSTIYNIYSKEVSSDAINASIDAMIVRDSNVDSIYFSIFNAGIVPGKIRCILNGSTFSARQTELIKRVPEGYISLSDILYNPKAESATSDIHTINLSNIFVNESLSSYKYWEGKALLDNDIQSGDEFNVYIDWSLQLGCSVGTTVSGTVDIWYPESGGSISSFPQAQQIGGSNDTYSVSGEEIISVSTAPYNTDPIYLRVSTTLVDGIGAGYAFARAYVRVGNIVQVAGGDTYIRGSYTEKTYQILQY